MIRLKKSILVIDDEEDIMESIKEILMEFGQYDVDGVCDPTDAVKLARKKEYDLMICDFNLPTFNGDQFFKAITTNPEINNAERKAPKFLLMSGMLREESLETKLSMAGGGAILKKPFSADSLLQEVAKLLSNGANA